MYLNRCLLLISLGLCWFGARASAVMFASTGDPAFNTTPPEGAYANSGWQYQGQWMAFVGMPIAPQHFITSAHISGSVGGKFTYQGVEYTTDGFTDVPNTDLRIWHVTERFPNYAPLYRGNDESNKEFVIFGRGKQRGNEIPGNGWYWGTSDGVLRWGTNRVTNVDSGFLYATFDKGASVNEAILAEGDSGGGVFIKDLDGVWKLAGVNYYISGPFKLTLDTPDDHHFHAALYERSGLFEQQPDNRYVPTTGPSLLIITRISTHLDIIRQITGLP